MDTSSVRQRVTGKRRSDSCMVTAQYIVCTAMAGERSVVDTKMIRRHFLEIEMVNTESVENEIVKVQEEEEGCGQDSMRYNMLSTRPSLMESFVELLRVQGVSIYLVFIFERLHFLHHGICKSVKK